MTDSSSPTRLGEIRAKLCLRVFYPKLYAKRTFRLLVNRFFNLSLSLFSEHVWEVQVHRRGLAVEKNIVGTYHLCLTDKALRLSQSGPKTTQNGEQRMPYVEFLLTTIRR